MSGIGCRWREDVAAMLRLGHFPEAASDELRTHIAACRGCAELVAVESALRSEKLHAMGTVKLEPAALLWWRAQLRRREQVMSTVSRPLWGVQIFSVGLSLLVAAGFGLWEMRRGSDPLKWFRDLADLGSTVTAIRNAWGWQSLVGMMSAMALLAGMVVYLAWNIRLERD